MRKLAPLSAVLLLLLSACSGPMTRPLLAPAASTTGSGSTAGVELPGPNDNLNAVAWTQRAIEHHLIYRQTYRVARDGLDKAIGDPAWEALPRGERKSAVVDPRRMAVILDIDETVLDNSPYQARLVINGQSYDESTWAAWCREERATALPGAVEFTRYAADKGVTVFYLSNRAHDLESATLANLRSLGFPIARDEQVFLGLGVDVAGCEQKGSKKGCRRELISRNYRVLMQFGDQLGDFVDAPENTTQAHEQAAEPYLDWIGERWFVLPNPTYGHWESALFNNNRSLSAGEQRRAKEAALRIR